MIQGKHLLQQAIQGANELYDMNQNVETTNDVTFQNITTNNLNSINCITFDSGGKICSGS